MMDNSSELNTSYCGMEADACRDHVQYIHLTTTMYLDREQSCLIMYFMRVKLW
jgi:hypothetical protein